MNRECNSGYEMDADGKTRLREKITDGESHGWGGSRCRREYDRRVTTPEGSRKENENSRTESNCREEDMTR